MSQAAIDVQALSPSLRFVPEAGVWEAGSVASVAYPEDDHETCFRVEDNSFWFAHRNRCLLAALKRFPPPGFVLDVGGGNGYVARGLLDAGYPVALLEPGRVGALNARQARGLPAVINASLADASLQPGSIPAVGLFDVLEHIEDDRAFIEELFTVVQPGGLLYLTVPAFDWLWSSSDVDALHFRRYTRASLATVLAGRFDVCYATCLFRRLVPVFALTRTLPYRLGLTGRRSAASYEAEHKAGGGGASSRLIDALLAGEVEAVESGREFAVGSSLLVVARRVDGRS